MATVTKIVAITGKYHADVAEFATSLNMKYQFEPVNPGHAPVTVYFVEVTHMTEAANLTIVLCSRTGAMRVSTDSAIYLRVGTNVTHELWEAIRIRLGVTTTTHLCRALNDPVLANEQTLAKADVCPTTEIANVAANAAVDAVATANAAIADAVAANAAIADAVVSASAAAATSAMVAANAVVADAVAASADATATSANVEAVVHTDAAPRVQIMALMRDLVDALGAAGMTKMAVCGPLVHVAASYEPGAHFPTQHLGESCDDIAAAITGAFQESGLRFIKASFEHGSVCVRKSLTTHKLGSE